MSRNSAYIWPKPTEIRDPDPKRDRDRVVLGSLTVRFDLLSKWWIMIGMTLSDVPFTGLQDLDLSNTAHPKLENLSF